MGLENIQPKSTKNLSEFPRQPLLTRFSLVILSRATNNAIEDIRTQIQTINESLRTIQTMIVSLTATKPDEIQLALDYINQRSQKHQMLVAKLTELDTPRLSDLQERLRHLQQREMAEPVLEKEQKEPEHER